MKGRVVHLKNKYILFTNMLVNMGIGLIMPVTTLYIHNVLHMSLVIAGYTLLLFSGAMALGNLVGGRLFDKWHTKPLMYIGGMIIVLHYHSWLSILIAVISNFINVIRCWLRNFKRLG